MTCSWEACGVTQKRCQGSGDPTSVLFSSCGPSLCVPEGLGVLPAYMQLWSGGDTEGVAVAQG